MANSIAVIQFVSQWIKLNTLDAAASMSSVSVRILASFAVKGSTERLSAPSAIC
jgi:hypothetical protein